MKDRVVQYPHRYQLVPVSGQNGVYDLVAVPGTVTEPGTALNKGNLLSDETADVLGLGADPSVNDALFEMQGVASYIAFATNANANSLDAAFGKGNEDRVRRIGKSLVMYSKYAGEDLVMDSLNRENTLNDILTPNSSGVYQSLNELTGSKGIASLVSSSPYARQVLALGVPSSNGGTRGLVIAQATPGLAGTLLVPRSGVYRLLLSATSDSSDTGVDVLKNGSDVIGKIIGYNASVFFGDVLLAAGDVLSLRKVGTRVPTVQLLALLSEIPINPPIQLQGGAMPLVAAAVANTSLLELESPYSGNFKIKIVASPEYITTSNPLPLYVRGTQVANVTSPDYLTSDSYDLQAGDVVKIFRKNSIQSVVLSLCCVEKFKLLGLE